MNVMIYFCGLIRYSFIRVSGDSDDGGELGSEIRERFNESWPNKEEESVSTRIHEEPNEPCPLGVEIYKFPAYSVGELNAMLWRHRPYRRRESSSEVRGGRGNTEVTLINPSGTL